MNKSKAVYKEINISMLVSVLCDCWSKNIADSWILHVTEFIQDDCANLGDLPYKLLEVNK